MLRPGYAGRKQSDHRALSAAAGAEPQVCPPGHRPAVDRQRPQLIRAHAARPRRRPAAVPEQSTYESCSSKQAAIITRLTISSFAKPDNIAAHLQPPSGGIRDESGRCQQHPGEECRRPAAAPS